MMKSTNFHWSEMLLRSGFFALVIAGVVGVYVGMVTFVAGVAILLALLVHSNNRKEARPKFIGRPPPDSKTAGPAT